MIEGVSVSVFVLVMELVAAGVSLLDGSAVALFVAVKNGLEVNTIVGVGVSIAIGVCVGGSGLGIGVTVGTTITIGDVRVGVVAGVTRPGGRRIAVMPATPIAITPNAARPTGHRRLTRSFGEEACRAPLEPNPPTTWRLGILLVKNPVCPAGVSPSEARNASAKAVTDSKRAAGCLAIARSRTGPASAGMCASAR